MELSPLCNAERACAYSCRQSETTQAAVTKRKTAMPSGLPVDVSAHTAQPETAMTATIPRKTGEIRRSPARVVAVDMGGTPRSSPAVRSDRGDAEGTYRVAP